MDVAEAVLTRFDPRSESLLDDPYAMFKQYRDSDPVHWGLPSIPDIEGAWYLFRYDDNVSMLRDAEFFANDPGTVGRESPIPATFKGMAEYYQRWLGGRDGQDHRQLRSVLAKAFTPKRIGALRPRIDEITGSLLRGAIARGEGRFDLIKEVAFPLPMAIVGDALGVKEEDWPLFQKWAEAMSNAVERVSDPVAAAGGSDAMKGMVGYFAELVERRRAEPVDDLLCAMILEADDNGKPMSEHDVIAMATELGFAGHETLVTGIGKAALGLMADRDRWEEFKTLDDAGIDKAVDELLRWTCPVQRQRWRWVINDTELGGRAMKRGDCVVSVLAAANRDPAHFDDPDRIDFNRRGAQHLTFGIGNHFCVGSQLARLEMRAALVELATQCPNMELTVETKDIPWRRDFGKPGPRQLPVIVGR